MVNIRKVLSIALALIFLTGVSFTSPVGSPTVEAAEINVSSTSFNGDTYNASGVSADAKWKITPAVATADAGVTIVNKEKPGDPGNMALRMFTSSAAAASPAPSPAIQTYFQTQFTAPLPGKVVTEFNLLRPDTDADLTLLQFRDNNTSPYKDYGGFIKFGADKKIYVYDSASFVAVGTYDQDLWTHVKIVMDPLANTYNLYVNGEKKVPGNGNSYFRNKVNFGVNSIFLVRFQVVNLARTLYLDDVRVYQLNTPAVTSSMPADGEQDVSVYSDLELNFSNDMDPDTLIAQNVLLNGGSALIDSVITDPLKPRKCTIKFKTPLEFSSDYTVSIQNLKDICGNAITWSGSFKTMEPMPLFIQPNDFTYYDEITQQQIPIHNLVSGRITGSVKIANNESEFIPVTVIMALYEKNGQSVKLKNMATVSRDVYLGQPKTINVELEVPSNYTDYFIKMFVWDSMSSMQNLTPAYQLLPAVQGQGVITFILDDGNASIYNHAFPIFESKGLKACAALYDRWDSNTMTVPQALELQSAGWEIMSHSTNHIRIDNTLTEEQARLEIEGSKQMLTDMGFRIKQFVAPYSTLGSNYMSMLQNTYEAGYTQYVSAVSQPVERLVIPKPVDPYGLYRANMQDKTLEQLEAYVDYVAQNDVWLVLYEHNIGTVAPYTTSETLSGLLNYIKEKNVQVMTGSDALSHMIGN